MGRKWLSTWEPGYREQQEELQRDDPEEFERQRKRRAQDEFETRQDRKRLQKWAFKRHAMIHNAPDSPSNMPTRLDHDWPIAPFKPFHREYFGDLKDFWVDRYHSPLRSAKLAHLVVTEAPSGIKFLSKNSEFDRSSKISESDARLTEFFDSNYGHQDFAATIDLSVHIRRELEKDWTLEESYDVLSAPLRCKRPSDTVHDGSDDGYFKEIVLTWLRAIARLMALDPLRFDPSVKGNSSNLGGVHDDNWWRGYMLFSYLYRKISRARFLDFRLGITKLAMTPWLSSDWSSVPEPVEAVRRVLRETRESPEPLNTRKIATSTNEGAYAIGHGHLVGVDSESEWEYD